MAMHTHAYAYACTCQMFGHRVIRNLQFTSQLPLHAVYSVVVQL